MKEPETPIQDAVCLRTVSRWERGWCTPRGEARLRLMALEKSA